MDPDGGFTNVNLNEDDNNEKRQAPKIGSLSSSGSDTDGSLRHKPPALSSDSQQMIIMPDSMPATDGDANGPTKAPIDTHDAQSSIVNRLADVDAEDTIVESADILFERLKKEIKNGTVDNRRIVRDVFKMLVGGLFNMEHKFVIQNPVCVLNMVELLDLCPCDSALQAEVWSVFVAIVRKSNRNLEACAEVSLITLILERLSKVNDIVADLFVELLGVLASYSIGVKEMKCFLRALQAREQKWPRHSTKLLFVLRQMPKKEGPEVFFSFSGNRSAGIALPPLKTWPYQSGWTFNTWFRMDPVNSVNFEREKPYLYCLRTSKGIGYSAHFVGNYLVLTSLKTQSKGYQSCIKYEFLPRKWYMISVVYVYNRWSKSEVRCYVNGQLVDSAEQSWYIGVAEHFDKCFIGCSPDGEAEYSFCGQMAAVYVFTEALTMQQVNSIFCLGPGYQNQFKYENETTLPEGYKKYLFDGKLQNAVLFAYCPKNCDRQLCLESSPKLNAAYFVHSPHALMLQDVRVVVTHSIHSTLHSVGGIQMLLPLFGQLDCVHERSDGSPKVDYTVCSTLLSVLCQLMEQSLSSQQQIHQNKGFLVISHMMQKANKAHIDDSVLDVFLHAAKFLLGNTSSVPLLKQLFDHILFNPGLWIHSTPKIQLRLYEYLSTEFLNNAQFSGTVRRVSTILQMVHALKFYYWVVHPEAKSGFTPKGLDGPRPSSTEIVKIRTCLLSYIKKMFLRGDGPKDDELQAILNFLTTVNEDENVIDMLQVTISLMCEDPANMIPSFDRKQGICTVFKLIGSPSETIRILAMKLLGFFLCRSTAKRKQDAMGNYNLFTLLTERLLLHTSHLTMATYNALFEVLSERVSVEVCRVKRNADVQARFENSLILKVIANLISQSKPCPELLDVKRQFLDDMITLCANGRENRRTVLQMSVWQEWLVSLAYVFPADDDEQQVSVLVYQLFGYLLYHAVKLEYGGWRVWVDTLAIVHSKVSFEKFKMEMSEQHRLQHGDGGDGKPAYSDVDLVISEVVEDLLLQVCAAGENDHRQQQIKDRRTSSVSKRERRMFNPEPQRPIYRTPEFRWSHVHVRLLEDLLVAVEKDVATWKSDKTRTLLDYVNASENNIFVVNAVHVLSQLMDNLIMACGGLLPLLAAATSPNSELEISDSTLQGLSIEMAVQFILRFVGLADVFVFASSLNFAELEHEKSMPPGGILRQCLRLVATVSVRNCLSCSMSDRRLSMGHLATSPDASITKKRARDEAIRQLLAASEAYENLREIAEPYHLLQEIDINRLKAVVYRDVEETKQAQFLALAVVYFVSVLMVSRYRDILEPPSTPSPFFPSTPSPALTEAESVGHLTQFPEYGQGSPRSSVSPQVNGHHETIEGDTYSGRSVESDPNKGGGEYLAKKEDDNVSDDEVTTLPPPISAIQLTDPSEPSSSVGVPSYRPHDLTIQTATDLTMPRERQALLTQKLRTALDSTAPLLREIIFDFQPFLQRTLLGTHGQEIMNDQRVLATLRNPAGSVVELVMLLCSQEWQTSLQKHAGLAFIELVNEGRLLAHATRDHIVRVANEADFILNRLRAEDVSKHAEFETMCAHATLNRKEEEKICDHLISAARRRDNTLAARINDKILNILASDHGAWTNAAAKVQFWKLDSWEDDSRRRKRLVPNPLGSGHPEATLKAAVEHGASADDIDRARDSVLAHFAATKKLFSPSQATMSTNDEILDEGEITKLLEEGKDLEPEQADQTNFSTFCRLIAPGVAVPGTLSITSTEVYFDCQDDHEDFKEMDVQVLRYCEHLHGRWYFAEIRAIFLRRYLLQNTALEIFLASRTAIMFAFPDHAVVKSVVQHLPRVGVGIKYGLPQSRRASLMSPRQLFKHSDMPSKWQRREISNFDYLMFLNTIAGRTFNDLNQYPVFPWVLSNYESDELDLNLPSNYRDLSKPIGALNPSRMKYFVDRYENWEHESIPKFHYGTHYSTAAFTLNYLVRMEPFTSMFLALQGGKFDLADRTFANIGEAWKICQRDTHDVKELIPEFFFLPEMFLNLNGYNFGKKDDGTLVRDVVLPRWAKNPEHFVAMHRQALESDLVSCQLNQWIDLIFGYKQRGPEAERAVNVFYYLTYEGAIDLNALDDSVMRHALENQIRHYGQTPAQLTTDPHVPRHSVLTASPLMFTPITEDLCMVMKFISNSPVVHMSANTFQQLPNPTVVSITANLGFALNKWNNSFSGPPSSTSPFPPTVEPTSPTSAAAPGIPNLPLTVDPSLATGNPANPLPRRHLGEAFDQRLSIQSNNFVTTVDSKYILACGYTDYSFRVIATDSARVCQVVYGHKDVVTCLARSECNIVSDCYIASGSRDCTVLLWHWNAKNGLVAGEYNMPGETPAVRAVLTGHDSDIVGLVVSAEHGLVVSASRDGIVLIHTTQGDLLRSLAPPGGAVCPTAVLMSRDCFVLVCYDQRHLATFTTSGRLLKFLKQDQHVQCMCLTRDGEYLVTAGDAGVCEVYRAFGLEKLYTYPACDSAAKSVVVAQNHKFILIGLASGAIVVFNVDFNKWHYEYQHRYKLQR